MSTASTPNAATFIIDETHTSPRFEYSHFGYSRQSHRFDRTQGTITLDRAARTASVDVSIDATSVNTGYALFNEHIQGEDFLDTAHHPTITFHSTHARFDGDTPVAVAGLLSIKGITHPVELTITSFHAMPHPMLEKDAIGANAQTTIKRSDFKLDKYAPFVSDELTLHISVEAIKE
ncbi:YceI family protein [Rhodocyclus tenuis]|uniref:Polyisoprenoid-binding protein n=2 Tax=Rhodocyclus TaxID=1064 RepID=A0A6L5K036_RHOTE|nr:YceI family protein [Rhodocyclus gracilis]MQY51848.1 polyisoprenoid-binding protein [Rhodocyclus gracilis]MRD73463.1 polyisoprenoid-binding protein [Rhodocyclus gracilis]NJA88427.1 YceI family protein [Rhodocyclus gracilis]